MWLELPYSEWKETLDTLHMWMEIVGKVKLKLSPFINQWWEVAFYVTSTGITTGKIPYSGETFQVAFDFFNHMLSIHTSTEKVRTILFKPYTVTAFYDEFMNVLNELGIQVTIWPVPVEV